MEAVDLRISKDTFTASTFAEMEEISSRNGLNRKDTTGKKKKNDTTPRQASAPQRKPTLSQSSAKKDQKMKDSARKPDAVLKSQSHKQLPPTLDLSKLQTNGY